jgi:16S rRNA (guanine527-N7)-methyltransferase
MLSEDTVRQLLEPFGLDLSTQQTGQVVAYLELLLRWNEKINLTSIRDPADCVRRHFGESLYLGRCVELGGKLLDIGSGAGFPGLCLKILFPELAVTLLEPVASKRGFLKEAARVCEIRGVEVRRERLEEFEGSAGAYDSATARAVGNFPELIPLASCCLRPGGRLFLWLSRRQTIEIGYRQGEMRKVRGLIVPGGAEGEIWWGEKGIAGEGADGKVGS